MVHGISTDNDKRLETLFERFKAYNNVTLRKEKCYLGRSQIKWLGNIYCKQVMSADPAKVEMIRAWPRPADKSEVKSFLQTIQFCQVFMRPNQAAETRTFRHNPLPLRRLTVKNAEFNSTMECDESYLELQGWRQQ